MIGKALIVVDTIPSELYNQLFYKILLLIYSSYKFLETQPMGIKQNRIVINFVKCIFMMFYDILGEEDVNFLKYSQINLDKFIIHIFILQSASRVISKLCSAIHKALKDVFHLLNNKTINPIMNRYDTLMLSTEETVICVFLFVTLFSLVYNLCLFYCFFYFLYKIINFCQKILKILEVSKIY